MKNWKLLTLYLRYSIILAACGQKKQRQKNSNTDETATEETTKAESSVFPLNNCINLKDKTEVT